MVKLSKYFPSREVRGQGWLLYRTAALDLVEFNILLKNTSLSDMGHEPDQQKLLIIYCCVDLFMNMYQVSSLALYFI